MNGGVRKQSQPAAASVSGVTPPACAGVVALTSTATTPRVRSAPIVRSRLLAFDISCSFSSSCRPRLCRFRRPGASWETRHFGGTAPGNGTRAGGQSVRWSLLRIRKSSAVRTSSRSCASSSRRWRKARGRWASVASLGSARRRSGGQRSRWERRQVSPCCPRGVSRRSCRLPSSGSPISCMKPSLRSPTSFRITTVLRSPSRSGWRHRRGRRGDAIAVPRAFLALLRLLARDRPVLVAVDDVQWLDSPSRRRPRLRCATARRRADRNPRHAARRRARSARPRRAPSTRRAVDELRLEPLSLGALAHLIRARLDVRIPRPGSRPRP